MPADTHFFQVHHRKEWVVGGLFAIQIINLVRIVSLFYIGVFLPELFSQSHIFIWQSVVILAGVALWVIWAHFLAAPQISKTS